MSKREIVTGINIEFPNYDFLLELILLMAKSEWKWEYSIQRSVGDKMFIKIINVTCYDAHNDLRKMIKKICEGDE